MKSVLLSIVLVFAHIAPPLLCRGGLLSHACTETCCVNGADCAPTEKGDCGHEPDCASDPCDEVGIATLAASRSNLIVLHMIFVAVLPPAMQSNPSCDFAAIQGGAVNSASCLAAEFQAPLLI